MKAILFAIFITLLACPITIAGAAETVKIAAITARTGKANPSNQLHLDGIRFAVQEINQTGGLLGRPIELLEFDNQSTSIGSRHAAIKAVNENVIAVIGAIWSSHSIAMAPVLQRAGIPMISPSSTHPDVTKAGHCIFRVCYIDSFQGAVMAEFAHSDLEAGTAAILTNVNRLYSVGMADVFRQHFLAKGGVIVYSGEYHQETNDFSIHLQHIQRAHPDVVFVPGNWSEAAVLTYFQHPN